MLKDTASTILIDLIGERWEMTIVTSVPYPLHGPSSSSRRTIARRCTPRGDSRIQRGGHAQQQASLGAQPSPACAVFPDARSPVEVLSYPPAKSRCCRSAAPATQPWPWGVLDPVFFSGHEGVSSAVPGEGNLVNFRSFPLN